MAWGVNNDERLLSHLASGGPKSVKLSTNLASEVSNCEAVIKSGVCGVRFVKLLSNLASGGQTIKSCCLIWRLGCEKNEAGVKSGKGFKRIANTFSLQIGLWGGKGGLSKQSNIHSPVSSPMTSKWERLSDNLGTLPRRIGNGGAKTRSHFGLFLGTIFAKMPPKH